MTKKEFHKFMTEQIKALKKEMKKRKEQNINIWIEDWAKEFKEKYEKDMNNGIK